MSQGMWHGLTVATKGTEFPYSRWVDVHTDGWIKFSLIKESELILHVGAL